MNLSDLVSHAINKNKFQTIDDYLLFGDRYLQFIETGLQARIISQNENHYQFFQYRQDGNFNVTRPLNTHLMCDADNFLNAAKLFKQALIQLRDGERPQHNLRDILIRVIYTAQQSIGAVLDALPSGMSNQARKVNGDLFERFIRLLVLSLDVNCVSGTMQIPINDEAGNHLFNASYQHDLLLSKENELKVIGSVKTSSKDRIDKVFMDKFLYNKLTNTTLPHIAIFLNDIQRKKTKTENSYGVSPTFLPGHFKAYTVKLNPLDGVYYCDIRPNMINDAFLANHIKTIDHFFWVDMWELINRRGQSLTEIAIEPSKNQKIAN